MALLTVYWCVDVMIFTIVAIIGARLYMTRKFGYWKNRGVMEIPPTPFFGNVGEFVMIKSLGLFLKDLYNRSWDLPYMGFYVLDRPSFLLRDCELIKTVLVRDCNYFADRFTSASSDDSLGKANLFALKNPAWKLVRSKLTPFFTSDKLRKMFDLMLEVGQDLDASLNSMNLEGEGRSVDMKELCAKFVTDLIGSTVYGLKVNSLNNPNAEFRANGREFFTYNMWRSFEMGSFFFAPQIVKPMGFKVYSRKNEEFLRRIFWDTMIEREISGVKRNDFIELMIEIKNSHTRSSDKHIFEFKGDNLAGQAAIFFTAGFETSSTAMSLALYELALARAVQTKLREEIEEARNKNGGKITYDMVATLPYLHMVVCETLRKYPPLPFLDRVTTIDYKVPDSDIVLEKGTPVYVPMLGLHYDPKYFPNPSVFDPERFNDDNKKNRKPFSYLPFGNGPHSCLGQRLGLLQTKLGLIHVLSNYELSPCKRTLIPMKCNTGAFLSAPDDAVYIHIQKITEQTC